jgi:hypothetical protein
MTTHFMPGLDGTGYDGYEAECKPFPTRKYAPGHVATVLTGNDNVFVTFERMGKG